MGDRLMSVAQISDRIHGAGNCRQHCATPPGPAFNFVDHREFSILRRLCGTGPAELTQGEAFKDDNPDAPSPSSLWIDYRCSVFRWSARRSKFCSLPSTTNGFSLSLLWSGSNCMSHVSFVC